MNTVEQHPEHNLQNNGMTTFVDVARQRAISQPDQAIYTFLIDGEQRAETWTYAQVDQRARAIAAHLQRLDIAGKPVVLLYPAGLAFIAGFLGTLYAGAIAVPLALPRRNRVDHRFLAVLADTQSTVILTTKAMRNRLESSAIGQGEPDLRWLATDIIPLSQADEWQPPALKPERIAFLQYTSGSTGAPNGVMISHQNLLHNSAAIQTSFATSPESKGVIWLPPYHDMGLIGGLLQPLYAGFPVVLFSPLDFMQKPIRWLEAISRHRATISGGPNFAFDLCETKISAEQRAGLDLSCWEVAFCGAEPIRAETLAQFADLYQPYGFRSQAFLAAYGLAESTLLATGRAKGSGSPTLSLDQTALAQHKISMVANAAAETSQIVSCGTPWLDQQVQIVDPESRLPLAEDEIGEIWLAGFSVGQGYWGKPARSADQFRAKLASGEPTPFLRTGDLGFRHQGQLYITGRLKDLIIINGQNYYPHDIEYAVEQCHPALRLGGCAAFSISINNREQLVVLQEIERTYIQKLEPTAVIAHIRQQIAALCELDPYAIQLLKPGRILRTTSGKVRRGACRDHFLQNQLAPLYHWQQPQPTLAQNSAGFTEPGPFSAQEIQAKIIQLLAQKYQLEPAAISLEKPFVDYGLTSVDSVTLIQTLEQWLGLPIPLEVTTMWDYPTIPALAHFLAGVSREPATVDAPQPNQSEPNSASEAPAEASQTAIEAELAALEKLLKSGK